MKNKNVWNIWEDSYFWTPEEIAEWEKDFREANGIDEDVEVYTSMYEMEADDLSIVRDEVKNFRTNTIIAIADLGLWNGRRVGYKEYTSIEQCLYSDCDYCRWYCDRYNFRSEQIHHDGTNTILYRERRDNISDTQWDNFCGKLYEGKVTPSDIRRYTRSIRPYFKALYGWEK